MPLEARANRPPDSLKPQRGCQGRQEPSRARLPEKQAGEQACYTQACESCTMPGRSQAARLPAKAGGGAEGMLDPGLRKCTAARIGQSPTNRTARWASPRRAPAKSTVDQHACTWHGDEQQRHMMGAPMQAQADGAGDDGDDKSGGTSALQIPLPSSHHPPPLDPTTTAPKDRTKIT